MPLVSVIVPIYNVEDYLAECLDSLAAQTLDDIEVILIDDGSTDGSSEIAKAYAQQKRNFSYYYQEHRGPGSARNLGISYAVGEYLGFVDADDVVSPEMYARLHHIAVRDNSDVAICNVRRFNSKKEWPSALHQKALRNVSHTTCISDNHNLIYDTIVCDKLVKRAFYLQQGFSFPEGILYEDIPVAIPMICLAGAISIEYRPCYFWRARETGEKSTTQDRTALNNLTGRLCAMRMVDSFFQSNPQFVSEKDAWRIKSLESDLTIFLDQFPFLDAYTARLFRAEMLRYIEENVSESDLNQASVMCHQKIRFLLDGDIEQLIALGEYEQSYYNLAPVRREQNRLFANLPRIFFSSSEKDVTSDITRYGARTFIDKIVIKPSRIEIIGHLIIRRLNTPIGFQEYSCYLLNCNTGECYFIPTENHESSFLTQKFGQVSDPYSGTEERYNYDGAGFKAVIDLEEDKHFWFEGDAILFVSYRNAICSGVEPLFYSSAKMRRSTSGSIIKAGNRKIIIQFDEHNVFSLRSSRVSVWRRIADVFARLIFKES